MTASYDIIGPTGTRFSWVRNGCCEGRRFRGAFRRGLWTDDAGRSLGTAVLGGAAATTNTVQLTLGGTNVLPSFAGLSSAGLYQMNLTIPAGLGTGDVTLVATVGGVQTQTGVVISLQ